MPTYSVSAIPALGGLTAAGPDLGGQPGEWSDIINADFGPRRTLKKRWGLIRDNATAVTASSTTATVRAVDVFHRFAVSSGVLQDTSRLVAIVQTATASATYYSDFSGAWTAIDNPFGSGTTSQDPYITIADGFAVFWDGKSTPRKWNQSAASDLGTSAPLAAGASWHQRRLFTVGEASGDGSTVKYCAASDITDWTGADTGSFALDENDGDYVCGVSKSFDGKLYFFKGPAIGAVFELSGNTPSTYTLRKLSHGAPAAGIRSIVTTPQDVYWLSKYGIHSLRATLTTGDGNISQKRADRIFRVFAGDPPASDPTVCGFYNPHLGVIGWVKEDSTYCLLYNYLVSEFYLYSFGNIGSDRIHCAAGVVKNYGDPAYTWWGASSGRVFRSDTSTTFTDANAAGTAANTTVTATTPVFYSFPPMGPEQDKQFTSVGLVGRAATSAATVTATVLQDVDASGTNYTLTLPTSADNRLSLYTDAPIEGAGRWIRVSFAETSANNLEIHGYVIRANPAEGLSHTRPGTG